MPKQRRSQKAVADFSKVIELNPRSYVAYYNRGIDWAAEGEYDKAIADYNRAIELYPRYQQACVNSGIIWASKGNYEKAIADLDSSHPRFQKARLDDYAFPQCGMHAPPRRRVAVSHPLWPTNQAAGGVPATSSKLFCGIVRPTPCCVNMDTRAFPVWESITTTVFVPNPAIE